MSTPTATVTTTTSSPSPIPPTLRLRHVKRAPSPTPKLSPLQLCKPLSASVDPLDLSRVSPTQTLASLRFLVLSHLADLERHISELESPDLEAWKTKGEIKIEEARQWAKTALEMLDGIRADVRSHLPDIHFSDLASVETFLAAHIPELPDMAMLADVRSHLPELPQLPDMAEMRSHLPEMPHLPDMHDVRAHLPDFSDMCLKLDDVRSRFQEIDSNKLMSYVPTLSMHLQKLHSHLSSMEVGFNDVLGISSPAPNSLLHEVLDALVSSELVAQVTNDETDPVGEMFEKAAYEVARAVKSSLEGMHLITYQDLPHPWRNNPFVTQGYRYVNIPCTRHAN